MPVPFLCESITDPPGEFTICPPRLRTQWTCTTILSWEIFGMIVWLGMCDRQAEGPTSHPEVPWGCWWWECLPWVWCGPLVRKLGLGGIPESFPKRVTEKLGGWYCWVARGYKGIMLLVAYSIKLRELCFKSPLNSNLEGSGVTPWTSRVGGRTEILGKKREEESDQTLGVGRHINF